MARPVQDVVHFAREWRNIARYLDHIQSVECLSDITEGMGAKLRVYLTFLSRRMSSDWETVDYEADEG